MDTPTTTGHVVLDLSKPLPGLPVQIDDQTYTVIAPRMLPPITSHRFLGQLRRLDRLLEQETLSDDEQRDLEALPDRLCRLILDAPEDVHARLTDAHRMAIVNLFVQHRG